MLRTRLADTRGYASIVCKQCTGTQEEGMMISDHKLKPVKVESDVKTHTASTVLEKVIPNKCATTIDRKQKIIKFFTVNRFQT